MNLRTRVVLGIVITTLCLYAVVFVILQTVLSHNYSSLETEAMGQNLERIQSAIASEEMMLSKLADTYSIWDETYNFVEDGNQEIEVKDDGIGISPEDQKRLFQPYQRLGQERKNVSGLGLGLVVS